MGAEYAIAIAAVLIFIFIVFVIYAMMRISSECSRLEENYRAKKKGNKKNDKKR